MYEHVIGERKIYKRF